MSDLTNEQIILELLAQGGELAAIDMVGQQPRLSERTIYVVLSRMEKQDYVTSRREARKGTRGLGVRLYTITPTGTRKLRSVRAAAATLRGDLAEELFNAQGDLVMAKSSKRRGA